MAVHNKAKELKGTLILAIVAVLGMVATFAMVVDGAIFNGVSLYNIELILISCMLLPIMFLVWLLSKKIHEVTELREQFYQSQKMEAIGRLAGGIAHDFNNILASSTGYAELLAEDLESIDPKLHNFAMQILRANTQAKKLVEQILGFSRKQQDVDSSIIDLQVTLEDLSNLLHSTMKPGVEIETDITDRPLYTKANANLLHQLIMNLCLNGVDAIASKGKGVLSINVSISKLPDDLCLPRINNTNKNTSFVNDYINKNGIHFLLNGYINPDEDYIVINIKDTGTGIPPKTLKKIFDPFFTTKGVDKGTGLGLATAQNILEQHKAGMIVKTDSSNGSQFTILLKYLKDIEENLDERFLEKTAIPKANNNEKNVLLVEDDLSVAGVIEIMLERLGYTTVHCLNALEALDTIEGGDEYDVVISDYRMPHMSGLEFAQKLYKTHANLPVILTTGFSDEKIGKKLDGTAIIGIVRKPMQREELDAAIKTALAK